MKGLIKLLSGNAKAMLGLAIIATFIFGALFAPVITKHAPDKRTGNPHEYPAFVVKAAQNSPDGWVATNLADSKRTLRMSKDADHVLGTTRMGRDVWSRLFTGRVPLSLLASVPASWCASWQRLLGFLPVTSAVASTTFCRQP